MSSRVTSYPAAEARRIGFRLHLRGESGAAAEVYAAAVLDDASEEELAIFYAAAAATSYARGAVDTCRSQVGLALEHAERSGDDEALGWAWTAKALLAALDGEPHADGAAFARATRHATRAKDVFTQTRIFINLSDRLSAMGHYEQAITHVERAFALLSENPDDLVEALARENLARALLGLGRCDEALEQFEQARRRWLEAGSPQLRVALLGIGDTHLALGNASRAASAYREVIQLSEDGADPHSLVPALAGLARATVVDDPEECDQALDRALDVSVKIAPVAVYLAAGWVALARDMHTVATAHGREAEREAGRRQDTGGQAEALELLSLAADPDRGDGRLVEARMLWNENQDAVRSTTSDVVLARRSGDLAGERAARARLRSLGVREDTNRIAGPLLVLGTTPAAGLEVHTLGAFSVSRDGRRVSAPEWPSPETKTLLHVLVAGLGRAVPRADAVRSLWPAGGDDADGMLEAVIEQLRTVLDPNRQHARDHYIQVDEDSDVVSIDPRTVSVDAIGFATEARFALACAADGSPRAASMLENAAALHTGRFLDDVPVPDWVTMTQDEIAQLYRNVRRTLAAQWRDQPDRAVPWLVGLVYDDPYDGDSQLALVQTLAAAGRPTEASRYYSEYAARMREVGAAAEPMPEA